MGFFSFVVLLAIAYLAWRISDQIPDILFRLSEIQRDVAEIRRRTEDQTEPPEEIASAPEPEPEVEAADADDGDSTDD